MTQKFDESFTKISMRYGLPEPLIIQVSENSEVGYCFHLIALEHEMRIVSSAAFRVGTITTARMVRTRTRRFAPGMGRLLVDVVDDVAVISYYRNIPCQFGYNIHNRNKVFCDFIERSFSVTKDIAEKTIMSSKKKGGKKDGR